MRDIVAVLTHISHPLIIGNIAKMAAEIPNKRLILCYDNTTASYCADDWAHIPGLEVMLFTFDDCLAANPTHMKTRDNYDSIIGIMYDRILRHDGEWAYLWFIENDVMCKGNWGATLARVTNRKEDMLATAVDNYNPCSAGWGGWDALHYWKDVPLNERWKAFVPIGRYSRRYIEKLRAMLGITSGWIEIYLSTLCVKSGFALANLPPDMFGPWFDWIARDEATWNSYLVADDGQNNVVVHPVKSS